MCYIQMNTVQPNAPVPPLPSPKNNRRGLLPVRRHLSISFAAGAAAATAEAVMVRIRCAGHVCCSAAIRPNGVGAGRPCLLRVEVQASAVGSNSSGFFFFALSVLFWILIFVVLLLL